MGTDTNSDQEKSPSINITGVKTFHVLAVPPQDLFFVAPPGCKPGQHVWVQGPHGPLQVQAPEGVKPGRRVAVRLSAPFQHQVVVPVGAEPGDVVAFTSENGEQLQAVVPPGKKSGQTFEVVPPVTMLRVPEGACAGDQLQFKVPAVPNNPQALAGEDRTAMENAPRAFIELTTAVPPNVAPGQYFAAMINEAPKVHDQNDDEAPEVFI